MQKNLTTRLALLDKKYFLKTSIKVLDGRIFLKGNVDKPEEKLKITKMAWETKGARSVRNNIQIGKKFSFKNTAKDILITTQLRAALIANKKTKSSNFNIDTVNQKVYVFGIAHDEAERREVVNEAKEILYVKDVIASILLIEDLSRSKD